MKSLFVLSALMAALSLPAFAEQKGGGMGEGKRRGPPPAALEACKDKAADSTCSFTGRNGEQLTGKCFTPDASKPMACKPDHHPGDGHGHGRGDRKNGRKQDKKGDESQEGQAR